MNMKKRIALLLAVLMMLSLAACGTKDNDKMADMSGDSSAMTDEPKNAEEALALHKKLMEQENTILSLSCYKNGFLDFCAEQNIAV